MDSDMNETWYMVPSCTKADTLSDLVTEVVQAQPRAAAAKIGRILFISIAFVSV